jgi:septum formation protein
MIILGSSSKYRSAILTRHGIEHEILVPDIDEKAFGDRTGDADILALDVCNAKVDALLKRLDNSPDTTGKVLVCSDQVVTCNGIIREKPTSVNECREFLRSYRDYPAVTHTALVLVDLTNGRRVSGVDVAKQYFQDIPECVIEALIQEGDVMYCAGGFVIDSNIIKPYLADRIGTEESIIGFPVDLFHKLYNTLLNFAS